MICSKGIQSDLSFMQKMGSTNLCTKKNTENFRQTYKEKFKPSDR